MPDSPRDQVIADLVAKGYSQERAEYLTDLVASAVQRRFWPQDTAQANTEHCTYCHDTLLEQNLDGVEPCSQCER